MATSPWLGQDVVYPSSSPSRDIFDPRECAVLGKRLLYRETFPKLTVGYGMMSAAILLFRQ